jgi:flagella basal body P-ring formation protein FlgA
LVVAKRAITTGHIIRSSDVQLQPAPQNFLTGNAATRLEDVVGKQAARTLAAGHPIDQRAVRAPVLVRRGEPVTVSVQVANVRVTTSGRAMADGSQGDLIEVQSLNTRERYLAQVIGVHEVAVYPRRVQVAARVDNAPDQGSPAPGHIRSAEPVVAVGHTSVNGTTSGWRQISSRNKR